MASYDMYVHCFFSQVLGPFGLLVPAPLSQVRTGGERCLRRKSKYQFQNRVVGAVEMCARSALYGRFLELRRTVLLVSAATVPACLNGPRGGCTAACIYMTCKVFAGREVHFLAGLIQYQVRDNCYENPILAQSRVLF